MGMLGEYEYDTVYNDNVVPPVTWVLYVAFLVTNCIIIMNLLVSNVEFNFLNSTAFYSSFLLTVECTMGEMCVL